MKKLLMLIPNGSEILEIAPFIDVFGWNSVVGETSVHVKTCGLKKSLSCTWNLNIEVEIDLKEEEIDISEYSALIVPGGFGYRGYFEDIKNNKILDLIKRFYLNNLFVVGVCTGVMYLGEAGVLKDKKATTYLYDNERYFSQLKKYGAIPIREEIIKDGNLITSSAPKSAMDTAFLLLRELTGEENMKKVKYNMGFI